MKKIVLLFCLITVLHSCYYDKAEIIYPNTGGSGSVCDTAGTISYSQKVVPIFQTHCYSCHNLVLQSGGIAMSSYATEKMIGLNGKLYGSISHSAGFSAMPQAASKLSNCQIATIKKWIGAGCPNN
jgi:cytochrome c553